MSIFKRIKKVRISTSAKIIYGINNEGNSIHLLYITKPKSLSIEDFDELVKAINVKFKLPQNEEV
jgi:hypothetical protein